MQVNGKVHCFFEQSGVFKREFIKLGIPAEDYDIQNNFEETNHQIDLFVEIEKAWASKPSLFDSISKDDLIIAFFPCIYFEACSMMLMSLGDINYRRMSDAQKLNAILARAAKREHIYELLIKMVGVCILRGIRIIIENPWALQHFLKQGNFLKAPSLIDYNRTLRGDIYVKPTAYWFFGCEPTRGYSRQASKIKKTICSIPHRDCFDRSKISPDYARNFICDSILGYGQTVVPQQCDLFDNF